MRPVVAVTRLLAESLAPFRQELEFHGITSTIDVSEREDGAIEGTIVFRVSKKLAERLASEGV